VVLDVVFLCALIPTCDRDSTQSSSTFGTSVAAAGINVKKKCVAWPNVLPRSQTQTSGSWVKIAVEVGQVVLIS
jgi:hypothetical protein